MVNKSGQFKIQETAFMILGTVLFFILVTVFYLSLKSSGLNKNVGELKQEEAIMLALTISNSPELSCTSGVGCIDYDKAYALKSTKLLESLWPIKSIEIRKIYPLVGNGKTIIDCNAGNYDKCNLLRINNTGLTSSNGGTASSYVTICRKEKNSEGYIYDLCEMGEIIIRT